MNKTKSITQNSIFRASIVATSLLIIPLLLRWAWTRSDFVVMGTMLFVTGLMLSFVFKKAGKYRIPAIISIILLFLWLWAELAVGLFTNWGS